MNVVLAAFSTYVHVTIEKLLKRNWHENSAQKMLMKLTPGGVTHYLKMDPYFK